MSFQFVSFCFQRCFATFWTPKTKQGTPCFRGSAMHIRSAGGLILLMFWTMNIQWKCHEGNTTIDVTAAVLFPRFRPYFTILASHSSLFEPRRSSVHLSLNKCNERKNIGLHWQPMGMYAIGIMCFLLFFSKHVDITYDKNTFPTLGTGRLPREKSSLVCSECRTPWDSYAHTSYRLPYNCIYTHLIYNVVF